MGTQVCQTNIAHLTHLLDLCEATQFAVAVTNHSALGSDKIRCAEIRSGPCSVHEMRWVKTGSRQTDRINTGRAYYAAQ